MSVECGVSLKYGARASRPHRKQLNARSARFLVWIKRRLHFGNDNSLEYRIYMIFFVEFYLISILSATTNTLLGKGTLGIILQWATNIFCTIVFFLPARLQLRISKRMLIFLTLIYIPFLFFQTAGYDGTAFMFTIVGVFVLSIVFKGKARILVIALNLTICAGCCVAQFVFPQAVIIHDGLQAKFIDYVVALTLSITGLSIITVYIGNAFAYEERLSKKLLTDLEQSNTQLTEMSNKDALTGTYNRRYLKEFMGLTLES